MIAEVDYRISTQIGRESTIQSKIQLVVQSGLAIGILPHVINEAVGHIIIETKETADFWILFTL